MVDSIGENGVWKRHFISTVTNAKQLSFWQALKLYACTSAWPWPLHYFKGTFTNDVTQPGGRSVTDFVKLHMNA